MLINVNKERSTIFIYLFGELIAPTLESYKYKQKFRLKRSKENKSILLCYIELLVGLTTVIPKATFGVALKWKNNILAVCGLAKIGKLKFIPRCSNRL